MRIANLGGRAVILDGRYAIDIAEASRGGLPSDPSELFHRWTEFLSWTKISDLSLPGRTYDIRELGPPVPTPRQLFAVAVNYPAHAKEAGFTPPELPVIFTKFPSCISGPRSAIELPEGNVDWEVELVVVIGQKAQAVEEASGWSVVAGLTVGQDLSERLRQLRGPSPQYSLAKSHPGFGPIGPAVVTLDEFLDPSDLELNCAINGEMVQCDRSSSMIFSVPALIAHITRVCPVLPGDLIFTGTPSGVGNRREPPRFLQDGDELISRIEGIGEMRHEFRRTILED
jgi:2,4-diketo-3-deoxy-L-fuconate hydrolase